MSQSFDINSGAYIQEVDSRPIDGRVYVQYYGNSKTWDYFDVSDSECSETRSSDFSFSSGDGGRAQLAFKWISDNLSITGVPNGASLCDDTSINVVAGDNRSMYYWYWSKDAINWNYLKSSTTSNQFFKKSDFPGLTHGQSVYIYAIGECDVSSMRSETNVRGPFYFNPAVPSNLTIDTEPPSYTCSKDGIIVLSNLAYRDGRTYNGEELKATISNPEGTKKINRTLSDSLSYVISDPTFFESGRNYIISIENSSSTCGSTRSFNIPEPPALTITSATITSEVSCNSEVLGPDDDGSITVQISNGKPPFRYHIKEENDEEFTLVGSSSEREYTFDNLEHGNYTFHVKDDCTEEDTDSSTLTLSEPTAVEITSAEVSSEISCVDTEDGVITVTGRGGTGTLSYILDGGAGQSANSFTGLAADTYTVSIEDSNGCLTEPNTLVLAAPTAVVISEVVLSEYNGYEVSCSDGANGSITITAAGGTGELEYSVDNGVSYQESNIIQNLAAGTYQVKVRDANHCESSMQEVTLTAPTALEVSGEVTSDYGGRDISCSGSEDGEITVSGSGGYGTLRYSIDNGINWSTQTTFTDLGAGSYVIKIQDANGCVEEQTDPVVISSPPTINITDTQSAYHGYSISCNGEAYGFIHAAATGGDGNLSYSWSTGSTNQNIDNLTAGTYTLTVTDGAGCSEEKIYILTEPYPLLSSTTITDISCYGEVDGAIDLDISGGTAPYNYAWSTGADSEDLTDLTAGTYSVVITDTNGCEIEENNIVITEPTEIVFSVSTQQDALCKDTSTGSITVNTTGGVGDYEYSMDGSNWQTETTFDNLAAGSYQIMMRDGNGCDATLTTTLTEPTLLEGSISNIAEASCAESNGSATVSVSGGTIPYQYEWKNSTGTVIGTNATMPNIPGGIYTVTVTDDNGCTVNYNANVSSEDGAVITASNLVSTSCYDSNDGAASLELEGVSPYTIVWDNGEEGASPSQLQPGINVVSITDGNGCMVVEEIDVPHPEAVSYEVTAETTPTCYESTDGMIELTGRGGNGGYYYTWGNGTTGNRLTDVQQGNYELTIVDSEGCTYTTSVLLEGVEPLSVETSSVTLPTCLGDTDGAITITGQGGNGGYSYVWEDGTTTTTHTDLSSGDYDITIQDSEGCEEQLTITLPDAPAYEVEVPDEVICSGGEYVVTAPTTGEAYTWESAAGVVSTDPTVSLTEPGTYHLTIANAKGCIAEDDFELTISDDLLRADFLMISEAYVGDTVVMIDISWPIPDHLTWEFPEGAEVLVSNSDYAEIVFNNPGSYGVNMEVGLANCKDFYSQSLTISPRSAQNSNGRVTEEAEDLIKAFTVSPNPNDGQFRVHLELREALSPHLTLVDISGNQVLLDARYPEQAEANYEIVLEENKPGIYLLVLEVGGKSVVKRIMIK
ncbi:T9SS type A sorting domain-containing protein [Fulvivirga maritima]|uniref:T9SS type A sorting domain-containing protein n=1 Tax=Fulvivirga maritima TaxID=2904247 RepID=UPI001F2F0B91|nr:T9SS type A sorting domain-containing protein [Fulvivirga maritima]UII26433.1 T9SS type A sorting domain-containing protein [Fulvivirga maritima]